MVSVAPGPIYLLGLTKISQQLTENEVGLRAVQREGRRETAIYLTDIEGDAESAAAPGQSDSEQSIDALDVIKGVSEFADRPSGSEDSDTVAILMVCGEWLSLDSGDHVIDLDTC